MDMWVYACALNPAGCALAHEGARRHGAAQGTSGDPPESAKVLLALFLSKL